MPRARSRTRKRTLDAVKCISQLSQNEMPEARKKPIVFVELDTRHNDGYTVSLEWNRDTGNTRIVVADSRDESLLVFCVPGANAGDAFRHPFRYAP
jgi:hypothetical protein